MVLFGRKNLTPDVEKKVEAVVKKHTKVMQKSAGTVEKATQKFNKIVEENHFTIRVFSASTGRQMKEAK